MDTRRVANTPWALLSGLALTLAFAHPAHAEHPASRAGATHALPLALDVPELRGPCEDCSSDEHTPKPHFYLDRDWRGVALVDLPSDVGFDPAVLDAAVRAANPAGLDTISSVSLAGAHGRRLTLLMVGRAARFADATTPRDRRVLGRHGLGLAVVSLDLPADHTPAPSREDFTVLAEHPLATLHDAGHGPGWHEARRSPRLTVSLVDRTLTLEIPALQLRRVYPVGVGALDAVRSHPDLTSLTPVTERARVSKKGAYLALNGSSWARGLPYIPFHIPWVASTPGPLAAERLYYGETRIAFHAWPGQTFMRGFNSHGCVTLRDADLLELAAFIYGARAPLPLAIRAHQDGAAHPHPHEDRQYWRLVNTGTEARPAFSLRGSLYHLERLREPLPDVSGLVGRFMDGERRALERTRLPRTADAGIPDALIP